MHIGAPIVLGTAALLAACNARGGTDPARVAAASGPRQCFYVGHVRGFRQGPDDTVIVNTSSRNYYALHSDFRCPNINFRLSIALQSTTGSSFICTGDHATLIVPDVIGPQRCPVRAVRKLTPAEVTALRSRR